MQLMLTGVYVMYGVVEGANNGDIYASSLKYSGAMP